MKTELEIRRELREVRKLLKAVRAEDEEDAMLYGAQQALAWVTGKAMPPSNLHKMILELAAELEAEEAEI